MRDATWTTPSPIGCARRSRYGPGWPGCGRRDTWRLPTVIRGQFGRTGARRMPGRMETIDHPGVCAGRRMHGLLPYVTMIGPGRRTTAHVLEDVDDDVRLPSSNISFRRLAYGRRPAFRSRNEGNQIGGRRRRCATSGLSFRRLVYGRRPAFRSRNEGNQTRRSRISRTSLARGTPVPGCRRRETVRCFDDGDQE